MRVPPGIELVPVVAGREVEADPLHGAVLEDGLVRVDDALVDRDVELPVDHDEGRLAPRVRHDRRLVVVDDLRQHGEQIVVEAARGAVVEHVRALRHPVHGLDVERLLAVPAVAAAVILGRRILRDALVDELAARERPVAVAGGVRVRILQQRGRVVGVGDRDRGALAARAATLRGLEGVLAASRVVDPVDTPELVRRVAADRPRKRLALELGQALRELLRVVTTSTECR